MLCGLRRASVRRAYCHTAPARLHGHGIAQTRFLCFKAPSGDEENAKVAPSAVHHKYTLPNAITMARIIATPYIGWLIIEQQYDMATLGFAIAGASDWLDGFIAKRFNQQVQAAACRLQLPSCAHPRTHTLTLTHTHTHTLSLSS